MRFVLALLLMVAPAWGHDGNAALEEWYRGWMRPDMPNVSCCGGGPHGDCYATEARFRDGEWYALHRESQRWVHIPQAKIEYNRENPDGRNHLCASAQGTIYCFTAGAGI